MNWKHGYYADSGYTYGYYAETMPIRMRWAALVQGHLAPLAGFRYLDAGCGQGLSLILAAASHPDSEFVGIDFLPEHIAHATELARRCGVTNVRFIEGDFIELAKDPSTLGQFDYAVCHGITTWIAPAVKRGLFSLIGQVLKPGGVFYNSYNTYPGWLSGVPFQHLVLLEQRSKTGALALKSAQQSMERLQENARNMFAALPGLPARLKSMETQDPAYLVQEYNNQFWQPVFVSQMMDEMAAVKLSYLGTATLPEASDTVLAPKVRELLAEQTMPAIREQLRDYAINQSFRRDLYVKGQVRPWQGELAQRLGEVRFVANPLTPPPAAGQPFVIKAGAIELNGEADFYGRLLNRLSAAPQGLTVGELMKAEKEARLQNAVIPALSMLLHGGWALLVNPAEIDASGKRCNRGLADAVCAGAPYRYVSLPRLGGALPLGDTEWVLLQAAMQGEPAARWADFLVQTLARLGRGVSKDGKAVTDAVERQKVIQDAIDQFKKIKLAFFRRLGAVD